MRTSTRSIFALCAAVALLGAACSSSEAAAPDPPAPIQTTTTETVPVTTTEPPPVYTWPLTGAVAPDEAITNRPAVVAKIDNSPQARPHVGLNQADVVYELLVEGITRFAAVFHSVDPDPVGPVRSARSSDIQLLANLERPLLLWSGANPGVTDEVRRAHDSGLLLDVSHSVAAPLYWRQPGRSAPYNLFTSVPTIREHHTPEGAGSPRDLFVYRDGDTPPAGSPVPGVSINFGAQGPVEFVWDAERGCWRRYQGQAILDEAGEPVCPANVVVQWLHYDNSSGSPVARSVGEGPAWVLSGGHLVQGRWDRPVLEAAALLYADDDSQPGLTPGATWVALPQNGAVAAVIEPERASALLHP